MAVTLENRLRQMQVFNLIHDAYCRGRTCACAETTVVVSDENPRTGERAARRVRRRVPSALTLLAREVRDALPDAVLRVPDVQAALARGTLRVVRQTPDHLRAAPPPTAAPAAPRPSRARKEG